MARRPSNLINSSQARAIANRKAAASAPVYAISANAVENIVERECDKAGRNWYRSMEPDGDTPTFLAVAREVRELATGRAHARQLVLERLERFPLKAAADRAARAP